MAALAAMKSSDTLAALAVQFVGLSLVAFGGANAVIPEIHRQSVEVQHWMTDQDFAALFAMYFTVRSVDKGLGQRWPQAHFDLGLETAITIILLLSSVTCQLGVFAAERAQVRRTAGIWNVARWGLREWYVLTWLMGFAFLVGQVYDYNDLVSKQHLTIFSSNFGSVFYIPTGFHGLHVAGGLVAFMFLLGRTFTAKKFTHEQQVSTIVVSYYWHFVDVVWIGLYSTIFLIH